jgi:eukaryotic-like serine/threonine-protein kinase
LADGVEKPSMTPSELPTRAVATKAPTRAVATKVPRRARGEAPVVLERYRLQRRLGSGAFGTVWQARDERLEREVAIKIVPRARIVAGRFEREARTAARLSHPGIVTLYEAAFDDHDAYLVSELVRGGTLHQLLEAGRLSDRDIVGIGIALCDALAHAHGQGVVHRDVKPSNVLVPDQPVTPAERAKLTDFGVARVVGGDSLTRTGDVIGTAAYMSPEQAEGLEVGPPADIYSLGLVIYEALTGVNPLGATVTAGRPRRLGAHLPPLRRQRRELPRELGQGIDLALRPRPGERGTIDRLRSALEAAHDQVGDTQGVVAGPWLGGPRTAPASISDTGDASQTDHSYDSDHRSGRDRSSHEDRSAPARGPGKDAPRESSLTGDRNPWGRGVAGAGAAALTAWAVAHLLGGSPLAPAAAALLAAALVIALPRIGWVVLAVTLALVAAIQGHAGASIVILPAALVPVAFLPRNPESWPLPAGAPALGAVAFAGAWPALAGRAATAWRRAALGATGWIWLALAGPLSGHEVYVTGPAGTAAPNPAVWTTSVHGAIHHVLGPLLSSGALAPAAVWGLAAMSLPWLVRRVSPVSDLVLVAIWSAITVLASTAVLAAASDGALHIRTAVLGAWAGALVAVVPTVVAMWRARERSTKQSVNSQAGLA